MLFWSFHVHKRHAGLDDTSDQGVSWVNIWRSRSPWGSSWWLSAEAVSLLVITWPFSHVEMSVTWTKPPFPPIWNNYAFASSGRKPLELGTEKLSDLTQSFACARLQGYRHGCVGFLVSELLERVPLAHLSTLAYCCMTWLIHIIVEVISRNKKVAK